MGLVQRQRFRLCQGERSRLCQGIVEFLESLREWNIAEVVLSRMCMLCMIAVVILSSHSTYSPPNWRGNCGTQY